MHTVESLRKKGYKVYVKHYRYSANDDELYWRFTKNKEFRSGIFDNETVQSNGGLTTISIEKDGEMVALGTAECSLRDNFSRKLGVRIALGRALKGVIE